MSDEAAVLAGSAEAATPAKDMSARKALISGASVLGAIGASACCIIPFTLFTLGVSGAWIGNLTALAPYKPIFVVSTVAVLAVGFFMVYHKPKATTACADSSYCARPASNRIAKIGLWTATVLVLAAMTFSYWLPLVSDA